MKKKDVIEHFGGVGKAAVALGILQSAVSQWGENVPQRRAFEIERITNGVLKADFTPNQDHA
ncbi:Cro/CI family transcriptional regulator [Aliivibrio sp. S4TY2]|uniref:Cro/CI family transcriptional regulator n=1 Tax=unclassified Aliivibrio TaxID=2645654 RepID=UPI002377D4EC|nr:MULTISPECIES: Cro/CI family transcriptional regulator [unclassified Aliivibrio]MDD9154980.1 Cro/CI family transcriptional regulator [Aliivibrio sp. S4TY2]MDD9158657.1 Cro/CI family transcriptional regulator [Aliivibrio sp. S4TY1]